LDDNEYINALEDDDIDESITREEEEEVEPPPCSPLQAALLGSVESAHTESATTRLVRIIVLEQTNPDIANHVAEISVEFAEKEADAKKTHSGRTAGHKGA
jgi:hypothetical protein